MFCFGDAQLSSCTCRLQRWLTLYYHPIGWREQEIIFFLLRPQRGLLVVDGRPHGSKTVEAPLLSTSAKHSSSRQAEVLLFSALRPFQTIGHLNKDVCFFSVAHACPMNALSIAVEKHFTNNNSLDVHSTIFFWFVLLLQKTLCWHMQPAWKKYNS